MVKQGKIVWHDIAAWGVEGKGWNDTTRFYDRLPAKAEKLLPPELWELSRSATGMSVMFETNATRIHARWKLLTSQLGEPNFPVAGFSGLDLYADDHGVWRWAGASQNHKEQNAQAILIDGMAPATRKFLLYLPLRNGIEKAEIGVEQGFRLKPISPRRAKPIVYYGTSIVHGAYASHAGMVHPSILGRRLGVPMINLGFSGRAKMEPELADLLGELKASVFVIDALPNMDFAQVRERAETFIRRLVKARPSTPIVLVEDRPHTNAWIRPALLAEHERKWSEFNTIYKKLRREGFETLHYVEGRILFGDDNEASLDSSHPSDLGYMRMAEQLYPVLAELL